MIEFADYNKHDQRPDIVNYCTNCGEISGSQFIACPACKNKPLKKKWIRFFTNNILEKQYPIKSITKGDLINNFIPAEAVNLLTETDLIYMARYIEKMIDENYREYLKKAINKIKRR